MSVVCSWSTTITSRRYYRRSSVRLNNRDKIVRIVPLVCNYILTVISNYQGFGFSYVVSLTGCQMESKRITQCVNCDVNLSAEAAARAS